MPAIIININHNNKDGDDEDKDDGDDGDDDSDDNNYYDNRPTWAIVRVAACATFRLGQRKAWQARLPSLFLSSYSYSHCIDREYFPFIACDVVLTDHY